MISGRALAVLFGSGATFPMPCLQAKHILR